MSSMINIVFLVLAVLLTVLFSADSVRADYCNATTISACGKGGSTKTITIIDMQRFCLFLPPSKNETVLTSEGCCGSSWCTRQADGCVPISTDAVAFCTNTSLVAGARQMPDGLIASAHIVYTSDKSKIQITGTLNKGIWIQDDDLGGQYDLTGTNQYQVNSPPGGKFDGYKEYVSLVGTGVFCAQACSTDYSCNSNNDYTGCAAAIPGDYGSGFTEGTVSSIQEQSNPANGDITALPSPYYSGPTNYVSGPSSVSPPPGASVPASTTTSSTTDIVIPTSASSSSSTKPSSITSVGSTGTTKSTSTSSSSSATPALATSSFGMVWGVVVATLFACVAMLL